jgi:hypothetical protein
MKRLYILVLTALLPLGCTLAQTATERCWHLDNIKFLDLRQDFWRSHQAFITGEKSDYGLGTGLYNITEVQYGFGLGIVDYPFAHHIAGATTALGWRFGNGFAIGGGTGFFTYNQGYTVPLFADMRYFMGSQRVKFFVALPAGFMLNFDNFRDYSKVFVNPGVGLLLPVSERIHFSFTTGLLTQIDREIFDDPSYNAPWHDSFINLKLGLLFSR